MNLVQVSFIAIGVVGVLGVLGMVAIVSGRTPRSFNWRKNVDKKALKVDKSKTSFLAPEEPESVEEVNITEDVDEGTDAESTEETDGSIKIEEKVIYEEISEEEAGITRRQFLTKALRISFGAFAGIQVISWLGFMWPKVSGGFGSKIDAGKVEDLKKQIPNLKHYESENFLEIAQIIKSSKMFIGNSSSGYSTAEALKIPRLLEASPDFPVVQPIGNNAFDFYFQTHFENLCKKLNCL